MTALVQTIRIDRAETAIHGGGQPARLWRPLVTLRAAIVEESIVERRAENGTQGDASIVFRVRPYPVALADRVAFRQRAFNIVEITPAGRYLDLRAVSEEA